MPSSVVAELDRLIARGVAFARAARALCDRFPRIDAPGRGDAAVFEAARTSGAWVLTADQRLSERLRRQGLSTIVPRDRTHLHLARGEPVPRPERPPRARPRPKG